VRIVDRVMSRADAMALIQCCDTYASLHRSEGFGLTLAEAMLLGKPAVGTNYSGNLDFMTPEVSRLVDFRKVTIADDLPQYPKGVVWAEPDEDHAGLILREIYDRPVEARDMAVRGQEHARRVLAPGMAAERVQKALENLRK